MRKTTWLLALLAAGTAVIAWQGNRAPVGKKAIVLNPATRQTVIDPIPENAASRIDTPATQPAEKKTYILINDDPENRADHWKPIEFPEAKLIVRKQDDQVYAFLCSKDPPEVLSPKYRGNRFYFELKLDTIDDPRNIEVAEYRWRAPSAEPMDTPNGIFVNGDRDHLQPYDILVVFDREGDQLVAQIRGQFLLFAKGQQVGQVIPVMATIQAKPEGK